jgi:hypothetical protein
VQPLSPSELNHCWDDLPGYEVFFEAMVSRDLLHTKSKNGISSLTLMLLRDLAERGLADETEAHAGAAGKRQYKAFTGAS